MTASPDKTPRPHIPGFDAPELATGGGAPPRGAGAFATPGPGQAWPRTSTEQTPGELVRPAPETVIVDRWKVACDGDVAAGLGHPRVWLAISAEVGFVECGYCDKRFEIDPARVSGEH